MKWLLPALCALMVAAPAVNAQTGPAAAAADAYEQLYGSLEEGVDQGVVIDNMLAMLTDQLASDPDVAFLERTRPGSLAAMRAATRPIFLEYSERVRLLYRPRMIDVLRGGLTAEEAASAAEFYRTPIGRKLIEAMVASYRPAKVFDAALAEETVSSQDVESDIRGSAGLALASLTDDDFAELAREIGARPALAKLSSLLPDLARLRAVMEEEPLTPDEERRLETAITGSLSGPTSP